MIQDDNPRVEGTWMHSLDWLCSLLPSVELKIGITKCWKCCHHLAIPKIFQNSTSFPTNFNIQSIAFNITRHEDDDAPKNQLHHPCNQSPKNDNFDEMPHNRSKQHH